ncbi:IS21-like element helper ATPase IstB [Streptomyces europaeiscabiei]|uniref:IS21-like element helper ATPase IstB n=1 Tax=Streptomyces europaeiscabiei TaxID=146819 RepID=UPI0029B7209E|nr:IS21-like element helper ATPase IstB [Streptomyces europaeiscabiei]MDX2530121.1 IS21-like element helper ATPase IstB [Streptomyces europaeiscabiei]MDX2772446.1 IS21-like element helper ATPase IstB [Streptomyces europaeiscabiei]MDX3671089.1 IS21-like element helper ATPase IstB [Streptomyces europaeiscabiei]MDX3782997.1 IS21-like element helper ATPase IstB [Streptomyces europaeiscabiei]MDX3833981.1 IS21-like element helper ATPase IstB [Streptomyces europaeiscabiei]
MQPPTPADPADPVIPSASPQGTTLGYALFATRWLQAPLYFGLVAAQGVYVYKFFNELWTLIVRCVSGSATETYVMLAVLKLVDVVMIANLLIMTIVGGYETFVSRIGLQGHRDQPEWLSHVNSNVLKVKLATAIVGISSVHLLQMFVDVHHTSHHALLWGTVIHMAFIASAVLLAYMSGPMLREDKGHGSHHGPPDDPRPPRAPRTATEPTNVPREPAEPTGPARPTAPDRPEGAAAASFPVGAPLPIPAQATSYENYTIHESRRPPHGAEAGLGVGLGVEGRVRAAGFPARKLLEEFDTGHPRSFDRRLLARLGTLDFLAAGRNVVFVGAPGTGKTHLAIGLGVRACQAGHRVLFATATEWAARLAGARAEGRLTEELSALDACPLLIVDEVGYLPFDTDTARLVFRLIAHRYERASLIVTSDRPLGRWEEIFGGAAPAMVDRLAHHAEIVRLEGDSYRLRRTTSGG